MKIVGRKRETILICGRRVDKWKRREMMGIVSGGEGRYLVIKVK